MNIEYRPRAPYDLKGRQQLIMSQGKVWSCSSCLSLCCPRMCSNQTVWGKCCSAWLVDWFRGFFFFSRKLGEPHKKIAGGNCSIEHMCQHRSTLCGSSTILRNTFFWPAVSYCLVFCCFFSTSNFISKWSSPNPGSQTHATPWGGDATRDHQAIWPIRKLNK